VRSRPNPTRFASSSRTWISCKHYAKHARDALRAKNVFELLVCEPDCLFRHRFPSQGLITVPKQACLWRLAPRLLIDLSPLSRRRKP
jgi:hypothetical protein